MDIKGMNASLNTESNFNLPVMDNYLEAIPTNRQIRESSSGLSELAIFTNTSELAEFEFYSNQTQFAYRSKDKSLALVVNHITDVHLRIERVSYELTFSAEALGFTEEAFTLNNGSSIPFNLIIKHSESQLEYQSISK